MRRIRHQKEPTHSERRRTPLLHLVRADIGDLVLAWLRAPREKFLIPPRLSSEVLFRRKTGDFGIADSVQAVVGDLCNHMPVRRVDEVVGIRVPVLCEVVVYLEQASVSPDRNCRRCRSSLHTVCNSHSSR